MSLEIHAVSTTISCQVGIGDGHLSGEMDSRAWGWNGGRSQFYEGDTAYAIVYKSNNLGTLTARCSNSTVWGPAGASKYVGYNVHREAVSFTSPLAQASKPLSSTSKPAAPINISGDVGLVGCTTPEFLEGTTVVRLKTWTATLDPKEPPPSGYIFIEHNPNAEMWSFSDLQRYTSLINTAVVGIIYSYAAATTAKGSWKTFSGA